MWQREIDSWSRRFDVSPEFTRRLLMVSAVIFVVTFAARHPYVLSPAWSFDSYNNWLEWPSAALFLQQGRPGQFALLEVLKALGVERNAAAGLLQGLGLLALAATTPLLFASFADRAQKLSFAGLAAAGSIFMLHPFQAEILTFAEASFFASLASALCIAGVAYVARRPTHWSIGALVIAASLSVYQLAINYACMMLIFGVVLSILDRERHEPLAASFRRPLYGCAALVSGTLIYFVSAKLISAALGIAPEGRAQLISIELLPQRATEALALIQEIAARPLFLDLPAPAYGLLIGAGVGWIAAIVAGFRRGIVTGILASAAVPALIVASVGIVLVGASWWPVPRVLGGVVLFFAMGIYLLVATAPAGPWRWSTLLLVLPVLLASSVVGYRIHADQVQVNQHDRFLAQVIYQRLIETPGYKETTPLVIVNQRMRWSHPVSVHTVKGKGDMNMSAFQVSWATRGLFALSTGRALAFATPTDEDLARCENSPPWPDRGAILVSEARAVVCL